MEGHLSLWVGFTVFIIFMLFLDLGVFQKKAHVITMKESLVWFGIWVSLALIFNLGIVLFYERGTEAGLEFFTGFLVEKSLSVDNVFIFILIFNYFHVPRIFQHKVLFWGIIGALILRIIFILLGLTLMEKFHWTMYLFGIFLVLTAVNMIRKKKEKYNPEDNWVLRQFNRIFPVSKRYDGNKFFTRDNGCWIATPLFVVLLTIESTDIVFAVDSIPAIFAITDDPFIVYTSNIFAMLGLRSLYFAVAGFMQMFHMLHYGFASIIFILGMKMLLSDVYKMPISVSLVLIVVILLICVILSLLRPRRDDLKLFFERSERLGLIPFRQLLLIENIVDLAETFVCDAMRNKNGVRSIRLDFSWEENLQMIRETKFSRYPLVKDDGGKPIGVIHVKDLFLLGEEKQIDASVLMNIVQPCVLLQESMLLEEALNKLQRGYFHFAIVLNATGEWTGFITLEDVLEELVGKIRDEFDRGRSSGQFMSLAEIITPGRVVFGVQGNNLTEAIEMMITKVPEEGIPGSNRFLMSSLFDKRSRLLIYYGPGFAIPHCRLNSINKPVLIFGRSENGIPVENSNDRIEIVFLLLTPKKISRIQSQLLSDIVGIIESDYVTERLKKAMSPNEVIKTIRDGQQVVLD